MSLIENLLKRIASNYDIRAIILKFKRMVFSIIPIKLTKNHILNYLVYFSVREYFFFLK